MGGAVGRRQDADDHLPLLGAEQPLVSAGVKLCAERYISSQYLYILFQRHPENDISSKCLYILFQRHHKNDSLSKYFCTLIHTKVVIFTFFRLFRFL